MMHSMCPKCHREHLVPGPPYVVPDNCSECGAEMKRSPAGKVYPIPLPGDDPRFTIGLLVEVARVIEAAGYPKLDPYDYPELSVALYRFIYKVEGR